MFAHNSWNDHTFLDVLKHPLTYVKITPAHMDASKVFKHMCQTEKMQDSVYSLPTLTWCNTENTRLDSNVNKNKITKMSSIYFSGVLCIAFQWVVTGVLSLTIHPLKNDKNNPQSKETGVREKSQLSHKTLQCTEIVLIAFFHTITCICLYFHLKHDCMYMV